MRRAMRHGERRLAAGIVVGLVLLCGAGPSATDDGASAPRVVELDWASGQWSAYEPLRTRFVYDGGSALPLEIPFGPGATLLVRSLHSGGDLEIDTDFDGDLGDETPCDLAMEEWDPFSEEAPWGYVIQRVDPPWAKEAGIEDGVRVHLRFPLDDPPAPVEVRVLLHRRGHVVAGGRKRLVALFDADRDGRYDGDADELVVDLDGDLAATRSGTLAERIPRGTPVRIREEWLRFDVADRWGRRVSLQAAEPGQEWERRIPTMKAPPAGVVQEGESRAIEVLEALVAEKKETLRKARHERILFRDVALEIGRIGTEDSWRLLRRLYRDHDDDELLPGILEAMGDVRYRDHARDLIRFACAARTPDGQRAALAALHAMDAPDRAKALATIAGKAADLEVYRAAVHHLAWCGARDELARLLAKQTRDPARAHETYLALSRGLGGAPDRDLVAKMVRCGSEATRRAALEDARLLPYPEGRDLALSCADEAKGKAALLEPWVRLLCATGDRPSVEAVLALAPQMDAATLAAAGDLLGPVRDAEAVARLVEALTHKSSEARRLAAHAAPGLEHAALAATLAGSVASEREEGVRTVMVAACGALRVPESLPFLLSRLEAGGVSPGEQEAVLRALVRFGWETDGVLDALLRHLRAVPRSLRTVLADGALASNAPEALRLLLALLEDEAWQLRFMAARGLERLRSKDAVPALIAQLEKEERRLVRAAIADALHRTTGMHLYDVARLWRRWWEEHGEGFEVPATPPDKPPPDPNGTYGTFYGITVNSDRVVFVIDQSGSMGAETTAVVTPAPEGTRLARAVEETLRVVEKMPNGAMVNVVFFESDVRAWRTVLTTLNEGTRADLSAYLRSQGPMGATDLHGGIERALLMEDVDTIYLLSDGVPSAGEFTTDDDVVAAVEDMHFLARAVIHTVAIGSPSALLRRIAELSGGTYVER